MSDRAVQPIAPRPRLPKDSRWWMTGEVIAWSVSACCFLYWLAWTVAGGVGQHEAMRKFAVLRASQLQADAPDQRLWSPERILAWQRAQAISTSPPLGVLRIPRIKLEVAVLEGTDETVLNKAVGHIDDTALPGVAGNVGIAGHRDGYFRALKDVQVGDAVELETPRASQSYRIERIWIVDPDDVSVLDPTPTATVTLVTCYPFYFVGSAPQRYIVRAALGPGRPAAAH